MPIDVARVRQHLKSFDFTNLFIEELGWDRHRAQLDVVVEGTPHTLKAVAEKRGMVAIPAVQTRTPQSPITPRDGRSSSKLQSLPMSI